MALAKDSMTSVQICGYNDNGVGDLSTIGPPYGFDDPESHKVLIEEGDQLIKNLAMSRSSSSLGSPSSANSNEFVFQAAENQHAEEAQSLINFRAGYNNFMFANGSLLCFQQNSRIPQATSQQRGCHSTWEGSPGLLHGNYHSSSITDPRLGEEFNCFQTASNFNSMANTAKQNHGDWLYSDGNTITNTIQQSGAQDASIHKRHIMEESTQAAKKQCASTGATKKAKPNKSAPSKDPQSVAAKNRRERISERLKVLQELVPNGSKVDLVTMLEKAISYVKFLQLQVKVLATDEFWPALGGKAPNISQVKEAIDAILSSQRDRNSCSSSRQQ